MVNLTGYLLTSKSPKSDKKKSCLEIFLLIEIDYWLSLKHKKTNLWKFNKIFSSLKKTWNWTRALMKFSELFFFDALIKRKIIKSCQKCDQWRDDNNTSTEEFIAQLVSTSSICILWDILSIVAPRVCHQWRFKNISF